MEIYTSLKTIPRPFVGACVTIGNFDGVHLGHQWLFAEVASHAYRTGGISVAITFDPHPLQVLRPGGIRLISSLDQKKELIALAGIDVLVIIPFTPAFAATPAEVFVDEILLKMIGMRDLVVGYDYAFGKGRSGDANFLRRQGAAKGFPVTVVEAHYETGMLVSSTQIRELITAGNVRAARALLGRSYQIRGRVQAGKRRGGSEVGFPTANLALSAEDLVPRHGVYACQVICDGQCHGGVMNVGKNPTFDEDVLVAETHIFDFDRDIYDQPIKVNVLDFLRDEKKFASVGELTAQITRDVARAKAILAKDEQHLAVSCEDDFNR
ncbi:MAG: bifunctional riboflavin kinase/FAD synthetase [Desulfobulbaceae bacterium]|jgi:riboflavin kinase/FMN adenylyltransferase|nr:bifunctional riboflavin kinase/FAD synthetase [Desulfobulbaceae bacterium]